MYIQKQLLKKNKKDANSNSPNSTNITFNEIPNTVSNTHPHDIYIYLNNLFKKKRLSINSIFLLCLINVSILIYIKNDNIKFINIPYIP